ncbi:MAG: family 43 glycosylhydrolase [Eubacterium sp.]|jgi:alpha-N-arabinofuranosidase|nr:family 43 glycosylhydrolase [Eubacterium sp.]
MINNPILPGFYPDPSICRVEDDFYIVTSSFSFFPGVPIFHSTDLVHWEQIGNVLDRTSQLALNPGYISGGIYAPTIRYHNGTFYMITTNVSHGGNFIVTAKNPEGPWSEPHWVESAEGIDPSLFWDDDGKVYYTGTTGNGYKTPMIWISELDLNEFKLVGEKKNIWGGALVNCASPESPHMYKKDGWYYLMISEGGTEFYHAVTVSRSKNIFGPYEGCPGNPILTHRHLGMYYPICNVGHADLVQLKDGSWYMVMLGSRIYGGYHKNMGRESFIAPVTWENEWPVVSPGTGRVEWTYPAPALPQTPETAVPKRDNFDKDILDYQWNFLGTPVNDVYKLEDSKLKLRTNTKQICPEDSTDVWRTFAPVEALSFVGRRQQHMSYIVKACMTFTPVLPKESAGLIILQNLYHSIRVEMLMENCKRVLRVIKGYVQLDTYLCHNYTDKAEYHQEMCNQVEWDSESVIFVLKAENQNNSFYAIDNSGKQHIIAENIDGSFLGSEVSGGFIGAYIGMFASGNPSDAEKYAEFDWFEYEGFNL